MRCEDSELLERYELMRGRIREIGRESGLRPEILEYFRETAAFIEKLCSCMEQEPEGEKGLLERLFPTAYEESFLYPVWAEKRLGSLCGGALSFLFYELLSLTGLWGRAELLEEAVIRMELYVEVYTAFLLEWQEEGRLPSYETLRQMLYWYAFDYADIAAVRQVEWLASDLEQCEREGFRQETQRRPLSILYMPPFKCQVSDRFILQEQKQTGSAAKGQCLSPLERCIRDHAEDSALILDKAYLARRLETFRTACEQCEAAKMIRKYPVQLSKETAPAGILRLTHSQLKMREALCEGLQAILKE